MIHVIATITVASGQREAFLKHFQWVTPLVRGEDGCIEYGAAVDLPNSIKVAVAPRADVVTVVEKWASLPALEAHLQAPHMNEYRTRVAQLVTAVSLQVLQPV